MYCILFFVFLVLASLSFFVVANVPNWPLTGAIPAAFVVLARISYSAAIRSAEGYGDALRAIRRDTVIR